MNTKDHTIMTKGRKEHPLVNTNQSKKTRTVRQNAKYIKN